MDPLDELLLKNPYEEVISRVDKTVTVISEYEVAKKELANSDWFKTLGLALLRKSEEDFVFNLENSQKEIKNGDFESALHILAQVRGELLKTRRYGIGIVFGGVFVVFSISVLVMRQKRKKKILQ